MTIRTKKRKEIYTIVCIFGYVITLFIRITHTHFYKQVSFFCSVCQIDERKQDDFILGVGAGFVNYIS
jgi:hypothetical protein